MPTPYSLTPALKVSVFQYTWYMLLDSKRVEVQQQQLIHTAQLNLMYIQKFFDL